MTAQSVGTLKVYPIKAFQDNYIWCIENSISRECIVVDPGDAKPVIEHLSTKKLRLTGILITHHHFDHVGGVSELMSNAQNSSKPINIYGPDNSKIKSITHSLKNNDQTILLGTTFIIKEVPGHTLDHIAFFSESDSTHNTPWLFCGDTLFSGGCGRLFEGTPSQMLKSLKELVSFPPETEVYCTHEYTLANLAFAINVLPDNELIKNHINNCKHKLAEGYPTLPSTIKTELRINPFLNCSKNNLASAVCKYANMNDDSELAIFTALRSWKDNF